ncbi:MAG: CHAD domain-containing protein [Rhizobacter sp.]
MVATLESCLAQIQGNAKELCAGAGDPELVHRLRVGLRRMRTALRELTNFGPAFDPTWEEVLRETFQALGTHRDVETVIPAMVKEMNAAGIRYSAESKLPIVTRSSQAIVRDVDFQRTVFAIVSYCHLTADSMANGEPRPKSLRARLARQLEALHAALARDAVRFSKLSPARQHRVRKRLKRLRYLAEFATPVFDPARVSKYLESWGKAQDALGEHNDHRIAQAFVRADKRTGVHAPSALRWLTERLRVGAKRCERTLRRAVRQPAFWDA